MQNNQLIKIDGALGAMIIEDQPTHSIYHSIISDNVNNVNKEDH
jgi:hypothetical protein